MLTAPFLPNMFIAPCNLDPLTPYFYIVKFGIAGVYIFLVFALKHRLWVHVRYVPTIYVSEQMNKGILHFQMKIVIFAAIKIRSILLRYMYVVVMRINNA